MAAGGKGRYSIFIWVFPCPFRPLGERRFPGDLLATRSPHDSHLLGLVPGWSNEVDHHRLGLGRRLGRDQIYWWHWYRNLDMINAYFRKRRFRRVDWVAPRSGDYLGLRSDDIQRLGLGIRPLEIFNRD